jgi:hypothetical protein
MPPRRKTGPQALDPDKIKRAMFALKKGASRKNAADFAGISHTTFYKWLDRGETEMAAGQATPHAEFAAAVREAESTIRVDMIEAWTRGATKDWRAARDWLARRDPEEWAPIVESTIAITVNGQATITNPGALEAARKLRDELAKGEADG